MKKSRPAMVAINGMQKSGRISQHSRRSTEPTDLSLRI